VHQVGHAVVAHDAVADIVVDFGGYGITDFQTTSALPALFKVKIL